MANEGEFPKADGDYLFASEVNTFAPKVLGFIHQAVNIVSGTDFQQVGGSILYSGGGFKSSINDHIHIQTSADHNSSESAGLMLQARLSGTQMGNNTVGSVVSNTGTGAPKFAFLNVLVTSGAFSSFSTNFGSPFVVFIDSKVQELTINSLQNLSVVGI